MSPERVGAERPEDWLVAHRGYPGRYPENSLVGMRAVLEAGARFVELDVQVSSDGHPVVAHDHNLRRVAGRLLQVTRTTLAELGTVAAGERRRFGDVFHEVRIPSLAEMLALIDAYPGVVVFVEIKQASLERFGREPVVDAVMRVMRPVRSAWVALSSDAGAMPLARARGAREIGWVLEDWTRAARAMAGRLRPEFVFTAARRVPAGEAPFWPGPWQWVVYGVDDADTALALRARGAGLIETDWLPELAAACRGAPATG